MRKLLFRVWDPNTDRMIDTNVGIDKIGLYDFDGDGITEQEGLVIMQFTGLLDRNGKEIYEGDILKDEEGNAKVSFENGTFIAMYQSLSGKWLPYGALSKYMTDHVGEIVGNIFENPNPLGGTADAR